MVVMRSLAAAACSVAVVGCSSISSMTLSSDLFMPPSSLTLDIDSTPQGAEARASTGGVCRTPCSLTVPVADTFTVTYALDGYLTQTVSVRSIPVERTALIDANPPRFEPNPVVAELKPVPPPEPPPKKRR